MSMSAVAKQLGIGWKTVNQIALIRCRTLVCDPGHLDGVRYLGIDEHKWQHVRGQGEPSFVTVVIDLTPVIDGTGPARLLDMITGRQKQVVKKWMAGRDQRFRDRVKVVAMDGFTGYKTTTREEPPKARVVMDPFHVVHLAAEKLDVCRQRIQQTTCGHRGRKDDPLYKIRRIRSGVADDLTELAQLGRSLWKRRADILAYFATCASSGPVEAINGRLEHLRGIAQGFRNLDHYILRSLLHSGHHRRHHQRTLKGEEPSNP